MENLNRKMDGLLEQFGDMKEDLHDNRNKIATLDKELSRRNAKLIKLEGEVQEGKAKFRKVEDELTNHKIKVKNLEEKIEKSNSKIVEVETELIKSKEKVSELEEKLKKYESRTDSWDEKETDSASPKVPEKKIREINRRLKVLEEKDQKAQEPLNPSQDDMEGDSEIAIYQNLQNSLDDAFVKCQNLVKKRKIFLSENELIELSAFEFAAGVKKGPVWQIAHHCLSDCQKRIDEKLTQRKLQRQDNCTIVQCLYLESCILNFNGNSHFFYVTVNPDKTSLSILEINPNRIALRNVKDKAERHVCRMNQIQAVDREDDLITLVNGSNQHTEIFHPELEESQQIFDMLQHFRRKSNSLNTQAALESTRQEAQDDLETEFIKYQERLRQRHVRLEEQDMIALAAYEMKARIRNGAAWTISQRNFDDLEMTLNQITAKMFLTKQAYVEKCRLKDSESQFFYSSKGQEIVEIKPDGKFCCSRGEWTVTDLEFSDDEIRPKGFAVNGPQFHNNHMGMMHTGFAVNGPQFYNNHMGMMHTGFAVSSTQLVYNQMGMKHTEFAERYPQDYYDQTHMMHTVSIVPR